MQREGVAGRIGTQMIAMVCSRPGSKGKIYLSVDKANLEAACNASIHERIETVSRRAGFTVPSEPISNLRRLIGTIRRECVDHLIVFGEAHLRRILREYAAYYNGLRTIAL